MRRPRLYTGEINISGQTIYRMRNAQHMSRGRLSLLLELEGLDLAHYSIAHIEKGTRFVTDFELYLIAKYLHTTCDELLNYPGLETKF